MIEIKLSQGAKPGHGGVLPGAKVTPEIAAARGVPIGVDCVSPARHAAFSTPVGLLEFVARLRELSGGKPTGFKLAIGHPWEWFAIGKAMMETGITPGLHRRRRRRGRHRRGAARVHRPRRRAAAARACCSSTTRWSGSACATGSASARSGKIVTRVRHRARIRARCRLVQLRARLHVRARLHPGAELPHRRVPDRRRDAGSAAAQRALVVPDKAERVYQFHHNTLKALRELARRPGLGRRTSFVRRISCGGCRTTMCACYRTCCRTCRRGCCSRRLQGARSGRTACSRSTGPRPTLVASRRSGWTRPQAQSRSSESYTNRQPSLPASACAASLLGSIHRYRFATPRSSSSRFNAVSAAVPCP